MLLQDIDAILLSWSLYCLLCPIPYTLHVPVADAKVPAQVSSHARFAGSSADALIMVPDFSAKRKKKVFKLDTASLKAKAAEVQERLSERVAQSEQLQSQVHEIEQSSQQSDSASSEDSRVSALQALHRLQGQQSSSAETTAEDQMSTDMLAASSSQASDTLEGDASSSDEQVTISADGPIEVGVNLRGEQNTVQGELPADAFVNLSACTTFSPPVFLCVHMLVLITANAVNVCLLPICS